jgi:hypothetical protein
MKKILFSVAALLVLGTFALPAAPRPGSAAQTTSPGGVSVSGKLTTKAGKFYITDDATHVRMEVRGDGLQRWVGQKVRISGDVSSTGAGQPQVLTASQVNHTAAVASKAAAAGVKSGVSKAAVIGVAGGTTAGTVGGLYAADVIGSEEEPVSRP